jgi:hypothetical protein
VKLSHAREQTLRARVYNLQRVPVGLDPLSSYYCWSAPVRMVLYDKKYQYGNNSPTPTCQRLVGNTTDVPKTITKKFGAAAAGQKWPSKVLDLYIFS